MLCRSGPWVKTVALLNASQVDSSKWATVENSLKVTNGVSSDCLKLDGQVVGKL